MNATPTKFTEIEFQTPSVSDKYRKAGKSKRRNPKKFNKRTMEAPDNNVVIAGLILSCLNCVYCLDEKKRKLNEHRHRGSIPGKGPLRGPACYSCNSIERDVLTKALVRFSLTRKYFADEKNRLPKGFIDYYLDLMQEKYPYRSRETLRAIESGKFFKDLVLECQRELEN